MNPADRNRDAERFIFHFHSCWKDNHWSSKHPMCQGAVLSRSAVTSLNPSSLVPAIPSVTTLGTCCSLEPGPCCAAPARPFLQRATLQADVCSLLASVHARMDLTRCKSHLVGVFISHDMWMPDLFTMLHWNYYVHDTVCILEGVLAPWRENRSCPQDIGLHQSSKATSSKKVQTPAAFSLVGNHLCILYTSGCNSLIPCECLHNPHSLLQKPTPVIC